MIRTRHKQYHSLATRVKDIEKDYDNRVEQELKESRLIEQKKQYLVKLEQKHFGLVQQTILKERD